MNYPSYAKDVILKFLQLMFSEEFHVDDTRDIDELEDLDNKQSADKDPRVAGNEPPFVNPYIWKEKQDETSIFIADSYTENMEEPEMRPALIISRGDISWNNSGGIDQMQAQSFTTGDRTYTDLMRGNVTINCISRNGLEAELLANICFQTVQFFAQIIREKSRLFEINSVVLGREALVESDSKQNVTVVPVGISLYIQDRWKLRNPEELISKIEASLSTVGLKQVVSICPVQSV